MKRIFQIISLFFLSCENKQLDKPNILFIMSDDHTSQAWGIYGGILAVYFVLIQYVSQAEPQY